MTIPQILSKAISSAIKSSKEDPCECNEEKKHEKKESHDTVHISHENEVAKKDEAKKPEGGVLSDCMECLVDMFNPFISLFDSVGKLVCKIDDKGNKNCKPQKITMSDLAKAFENMQTKDVFKNKELQEQFNQLQATISELSKEHGNMDITNLIQDWKNNKNFETFFEISRKVQSGELDTTRIARNNPKLIQGLKELFRVTEQGIKETIRNGGEHVARRQFGPVADKVVSSAEKIAGTKDEKSTTPQGSTPEQISTEQTKKDKEIVDSILDDMESASNNLKQIAQDPEMECYLSAETRSEMLRVVEFVNDMLNEIRERQKEQELEEEKKKQEKLCEQRHKEIEKYKHLKEKYFYALRKFYSSKEISEKKRKDYEVYLTALLKRLEKYGFTRDELERKFQGLYLTEKSDSKKYGGQKDSLDKDSQKILEELPPPSVCEEHGLYNFDFSV